NLSSTFSFLSKRNGPKGRTEATSPKKVFEKDQPSFLLVGSSITTYNIKRTPWIQPTYFTINGISNPYFKGMAINSRTSMEMPSIKLMILNLLSVDNFSS